MNLIIVAMIIIVVATVNLITLNRYGKALIKKVSENMTEISLDLMDMVEARINHDDLDAIACNRKCQDRRSPNKYQTEQLERVGVAAMNKKIDEAFGPQDDGEHKESICLHCEKLDTCEKGEYARENEYTVSSCDECSPLSLCEQCHPEVQCEKRDPKMINCDSFIGCVDAAVFAKEDPNEQKPEISELCQDCCIWSTCEKREHAYRNGLLVTGDSCTERDVAELNIEAAAATPAEHAALMGEAPMTATEIIKSEAKMRRLAAEIDQKRPIKTLAEAAAETLPEAFAGADLSEQDILHDPYAPENVDPADITEPEEQLPAKLYEDIAKGPDTEEGDMLDIDTTDR